MIGKRIIFTPVYNGPRVEADVFDKVILPKEVTTKFLGISFTYFVPATYYLVRIVKTEAIIRIPADPNEKSLACAT